MQYFLDNFFNFSSYFIQIYIPLAHKYEDKHICVEFAEKMKFPEGGWLSKRFTKFLKYDTQTTPFFMTRVSTVFWLGSLHLLRWCGGAPRRSYAIMAYTLGREQIMKVIKNLEYLIKFIKTYFQLYFGYFQIKKLQNRGHFWNTKLLNIFRYSKL